MPVGSQLRFFGDGYQISKLLAGRRLWRIPVMDGEFLVDERFGIQPAVGGGNFLILGRDQRATLAAAEAAVAAMRGTPGAILPFPGRRGAQRQQAVGPLQVPLRLDQRRLLPDAAGGGLARPRWRVNAGCVLEIVIDGLDLAAVETAMRRGMHAAAQARAPADLRRQLWRRARPVPRSASTPSWKRRGI